MPKLTEWKVTFQRDSGTKVTLRVWTANQRSAREAICSSESVKPEAILAVVKMKTVAS